MEIGDINEADASPHGTAYHNYYHLYQIRSLLNNRWDYESLRSCLDEFYEHYSVKVYDTIQEFNAYLIPMILSSPDKKDIEKASELFYKLNGKVSSLPKKFSDKDIDRYGNSFKLSAHLLLEYLQGNFQSKADLVKVFDRQSEVVTAKWERLGNKQEEDNRVSRFYSIETHFDFQKVRNLYCYGIDEPRLVAKKIKGYDE